MLDLGLVALCLSFFLLGLLVGIYSERSKWVLKANLQHGRMLANGTFFWVVCDMDYESQRWLMALWADEMKGSRDSRNT